MQSIVVEEQRRGGASSWRSIVVEEHRSVGGQEARMVCDFSRAPLASERALLPRVTQFASRFGPMPEVVGVEGSASMSSKKRFINPSIIKSRCCSSTRPSTYFARI